MSTSPIRVLLVDHAPVFGGSESFLLDLVSELDRSRFAPSIVTDPNSPILGRLRESGTPVLTTPLPRINRNPLFPWHLWRAGAPLARTARTAQADLIHTFTARAHLIGAVASQLSGIPLLWRICDDTLPAWILSAFAGVPRRKVAASQWLTKHYSGLRFDGLAPDGARAPRAVSTAVARAQFGLAVDDLAVAHLGRLVRWKGQAVFLRALAEVPRQQANVRGLVIGGWAKEDEQPGPLGGGETYYRELCNLAVDLGLNSGEDKHVVFTGFLRDPVPAYVAADVVVHSSLLPEPFGRTVIEAMMAGRAVVAARAGALPEIVIDGQTGLLTPPGDVPALAEALRQLLQDPALRERLGQAARQRAEAEFSLARMTRRMEQHYLAVLESR